MFQSSPMDSNATSIPSSPSPSSPSAAAAAVEEEKTLPSAEQAEPVQPEEFAANSTAEEKTTVSPLEEAASSSVDVDGDLGEKGDDLEEGGKGVSGLEKEGSLDFLIGEEASGIESEFLGYSVDKGDVLDSGAEVEVSEGGEVEVFPRGSFEGTDQETVSDADEIVMEPPLRTEVKAVDIGGEATASKVTRLEPVFTTPIAMESANDQNSDDGDNIHSPVPEPIEWSGSNGDVTESGAEQPAAVVSEKTKESIFEVPIVQDVGASAKPADVGGIPKSADDGGITKSADDGGIKMSAGDGGIAKSAGDGGIAKSADVGGIAKSADVGGIAKSADDGGIAKSADDGGIAKSADDGGIAKSADDGGIAKSADDGGIAKSADDGGIAKSADDGGIAKSADDGGIAADDGGIAKSADDGGIAKSADDGGIAKSADDGGIAKSADDGGIAKSADDGGIAKSADDGGNAKSADDVETTKESASEAVIVHDDGNRIKSVENVETINDSAPEVVKVDADVGNDARKITLDSNDENLSREIPEFISKDVASVHEIDSAEKLPTLADNGHAKAMSDDDITPSVKGNDPEMQGAEGGSSITDEPSKIAILGSSETAKQILKDLNKGSMATQDYSHDVEGQIVSDTDEEVETDEDGDGKELFDSAALAALLRAASGASSDGNITISAPDAARIFSVDRPAGLGSSMSSLRPNPSRPARSSLFGSSEVAVVEDAEMDEEEKKLHDKVEQIRVKFLRLVHRLGHSPEDTVAAQVLYRLGLAEGIKRGRQTSRTFSLESAKKKALQMEEDGQEDLEFSCNILVIGKTGVGKSETINSIFGERVATTNAFQPSTTHVKEIVGVVDGVNVRFIDTPGLTPSVMDQTSNKKILSSIKKYMKKCPPDIVLYVDRLDTQTRDFNDLPLLRSITSTLGSSIWFKAIVALTHSASAPPDGPNGTTLSYDVFVAQRSHVVQHSIRQAAGDMRLMNPVALVENHPSCRRSRGQRILPNGIAWRPQLLLLCYSSKTLSEANSLLKLQDPSPGKLFGFRVRSPPLPYLLSSLLQSRPHPKLASDQGDYGDSDIDLGDLSDFDKEEEEDEYDQLPPFKPLKKAQIAMLTKEQKKAYYDEYDYRLKLLQKKQWKDEVKKMKEMKKRGKEGQPPTNLGYGEDDYDQDAVPAAVPVPLPDMVLPPTFGSENPAYRYRFLEPTSQLLARPVLDSHGWDHDCGYDGVSLEENLALAGRFPGTVAVQITKDKKDFSIHMDSAIAAKLGENGSSLAGFDIQSIGKQLAYILKSEAKFKNLKNNKTTAGASVTFLGENVATGLKIEDQILIGNRVSLAASTGAIRSQGDTAYGANLEGKLREKDYPVGQEISTLGLSLMKWRGDLALGANLQSQLSLGRGSKMTARVGLNNKLTGQISLKTSTSEQLHLALLGILPIAVSIYRTIFPGELVQ